MKKLLTPCFLMLTGLFLSTSCNNEETLLKSDLDIETYSLLQETLAADLNHMASVLRKQSTEDKSKVVTKIAKNYYGQDSKEFNVFCQSASLVNQPGNGRVTDQLSLTNFQQDEVDKLIMAVEDFSTIPEYKEYLNNKFTKYANSEISI